jgi:hypothetical protein
MLLEGEALPINLRSSNLQTETWGIRKNDAGNEAAMNKATGRNIFSKDDNFIWHSYDDTSRNSNTSHVTIF